MGSRGESADIVGLQTLIHPKRPLAVFSLSNPPQATSTTIPNMDQYDTLELRNRDVTETLSNVSDFGFNDKYDNLDLRNRTIVETLSPVDDLGQDKKDAGENGDTNGKEVEEKKFDELELRNRTVTETLSPLENLGQDKKKEKTSSNGVNGAAPEEKKFDELELRNRTVTEILSPVADLGQDNKEDDDTGEVEAKRQKLDGMSLASEGVKE